MARNEVIDRTQQGKNVNGRKFKGYSKDYADFKGVPRSDVDLTLFGDMLNSIETEIKGDSVVIKIDDENQAIKAFAHLSGYEGHPTIKNGPVRDFFGLTDKRAEELASQVKVIESTPGLLDILGTAPINGAPTQTSITSILTQIGLLNDES